MASLFREALVRANGFLLESPPAGQAHGRRAFSQTEVAVLGLSAGCGVTTLARGLALSLEVPDERPSHVFAIGGDAADGRAAASVGGGLSALVWDVAASHAASARGVAHRADAVVLVAGAGSEPALAEIAARTLREDLGRVVLVANRVTDESRWSGRPDLCVPDSRLGAALLGRGRRPPGAFGAALAKLAELVEER